LVNRDGNLTALVDWECVSTLPLWNVSQVLSRKDKPTGYWYSKEENGKVYWEHLLEYEKTQLRAVFLREIEPGWIKVLKTNRQKVDFEFCLKFDQ